MIFDIRPNLVHRVLVTLHGCYFPLYKIKEELELRKYLGPGQKQAKLCKSTRTWP